MKYDYKTLVSLWNSRRKSNDYKPLGNNGKLYKDGDTIKYKLYNTFIATIYPDNTVEFTAGDYVGYTTTYSRMSNLFLPSGVYLTSDKTNHRNKLQPVRLKRFKWNSGMEHYDYPYKDGVRIRMTDGEILNPEILVDFDRVRTTNRKMATEMKRKVAALRKLTHVMAKVGALQKPEGYRWNYNNHVNKIMDINLDEPSSNDAQFVLELGFAHTDIGWREEFPVKRVIDNGLKKIREHYYIKNDAYSYEVKQRDAA